MAYLSFEKQVNGPTINIGFSQLQANLIMTKMHYLLLMVNCNNVIISFIEKQTHSQNARHMLKLFLIQEGYVRQVTLIHPK